jgi:hypothetical protein
MPDVDGMEISPVQFPLVRNRILLALDYSITCKPALPWIAPFIDAVPSNRVHAEHYKLEGDVLKRLRNVTDCSLDEFMVTIMDHVAKRSMLLKRLMGQLT